MKFLKQRLLPALLALALLVSACPAALASGAGGTFCLAAVTADQVIVEPEAVSYESGQTIRQALLASGHQFTGLDGGFITAVDGVAASYYLYYDGGAYDLDAPAARVTGLLITTQSAGWSEDLHALLLRMGQYRQMDTGVQQYPDARSAYSAALDILRQGRTADAKSGLDALNDAIAKFDALMTGDKSPVTFQITQNGQPFTGAELTLTGRYGDVHTARGTQIAVIPGEYDFTVSDGGVNRTEGTVEVPAGGTAVTLRLPGGSWFGNAELLPASGSQDAFAAEALDTGRRCFVPDHLDGTAYLYAVRGTDLLDQTNTVLRVCYTGSDGVDYSGVSKPWESRYAALNHLLVPGMADQTFCLEAVYQEPDSGYTMIQRYDMEIRRIPTLSALQILSDGVSVLQDFEPDTLEYALTVSASKLSVTPTAFGGDGYGIRVDSIPAASGGNVEVSSRDFSVTVTHTNGQSRVYAVHVNQVSTVPVTLRHDAGVTVQVLYGSAEVAPATVGQTADTYQLIRGETYTYVTTKNDHYHTRAAFTAAQGLSLSAASPETDDWLTGLEAANTTRAQHTDSETYRCEPAFSPAVHAYDFYVGDCNSSFALWATASAAAGSATITAQYTQLSNGLEKSVAVESGKATGTSLSGFVQTTAYSNQAVLHIAKTVADVEYYQDYTLRLRRVLHAPELSLTAGGSPVTLEPEYDRDIPDYKAKISQSTTEAVVTLTFPGTLNTPATYGGYTAEITAGGTTQVAEFQYNTPVSVPLSLDPSLPSETIQVRLRHEDSTAVETVYSFLLQKLPPVAVSFRCTPSDAVVNLLDTATNQRVWPDDSGAYALLSGRTYAYTVSRAGYISKTGTLLASTGQTVPVTLTQAPANTALPTDFEAQWPDFRGSRDNNAVVDAPIPTTDSDAVLYWANQLGSGMDSEAVGCPILAGGYLYTYAGTTLYKLDTVTGQEVARGNMAASSSYAINNPTYADGMIFIGLSGGRVQAFNAETLESLWVYSDPLKGQPNCNIVYRNGYLYTGFWNGETQDANYVCLTATDEDPGNPLEEKTAVWRHTAKGGYYWAGACVRDGYLLIGTDDGVSGYAEGYASLLSLDPRTGKLLDSLEMPQTGDIRSAITYDDATGAYYFTSKGGYFYQVKVDDATGAFVPDSLRWIPLQSGSAGAAAMSTSTPVVYNGRAYIGTCGAAQFTAYTGHSIAVLDLKSWKLAYSVPTQGYPQTSGLLTTAYGGEDDTVYVYFFDNYTPGKLRVIQDRPGQTEGMPLITETYRRNGKEYTVQVADSLFTPCGAQAEYAICSPISDENGTIYFKNDSGHLMALGSTIASIAVTTPPNRLRYRSGDTFDPTGMTVTATYTNGTTRDITNYVTYSADPLTPDDTEFQLRFEHVLYQNRDGNAGVTYTAPTTVLDLKIEGASADELAAEAVEKLIRAIGDVTRDSGNSIRAAREAYDRLTDAQKELVSNYGKLTAAEEAYGVLTIALPFTDVSENAWYCGAVRYTYYHGLFSGISDTKFGPNITMSRGMLVTVLYRLEGEPSVAGQTHPFTDVPAGRYFTDAIVWASNNGVVNGVTAASFAPNALVTREQMVTILYRYANLKGYDTSIRGALNGFPDRDQVSNYAKDAVSWAVGAGLIQGDKNGDAVLLHPRHSATRAQVATILMRYRTQIVEIR